MGANTSDADFLVGLGRGRGSRQFYKQSPNAAGYLVWQDFFFDALSGGTVYTITPSGGIVFNGQATQIQERVYLPTGNLFFSGTAPITFVPYAPATYIITPTGGISFSGAASFRFTKVLSAGGSLSFLGTALQLKTRAQVPTGSVTFTGTSVFFRTKTYLPTGSLTFSGTAPITFNDTPAGSVTNWRTMTGTGL